VTSWDCNRRYSTVGRRFFENGVAAFEVQGRSDQLAEKERIVAGEEDPNA
jgi:hypothetical protein